MKIVLLGGTRGIGRALARELAARGHSLFLLGRDADDLARSAADLSIRSAIRSGGDAPGYSSNYALCDLAQPDSFEPALDAADQGLGDFDAFVSTAGAFGTQEELESDPELCARVLALNFSHTVLLCEAVRARLLARGGGTLCVLSSVAGDRGRKPTVLYGATKAGLSRYLEGLDHRDRAKGLRTVCVKPGFVRSSMTSGLDPPPFASDPETIAPAIAGAIETGRPVLYVPRIWSLVMFVIRLLPRSVMRRVGF